MFAPPLPPDGLLAVALSTKAVIVTCWPEWTVVGGVVIEVAVLHRVTVSETVLEFELAL